MLVNSGTVIVPDYYGWVKRRKKRKKKKKCLGVPLGHTYLPWYSTRPQQQLSSALDCELSSSVHWIVCCFLQCTGLCAVFFSALDCVLFSPVHWIVCCLLQCTGLFAVFFSALDCVLSSPVHWIVCCLLQCTGLCAVFSSALDCVLSSPVHWIVCCLLQCTGLCAVFFSARDSALSSPVHWIQTSKSTSPPLPLTTPNLSVTSVNSLLKTRSCMTSLFQYESCTVCCTGHLGRFLCSNTVASLSA